MGKTRPSAPSPLQTVEELRQQFAGLSAGEINGIEIEEDAPAVAPAQPAAPALEVPPVVAPVVPDAPLVMPLILQIELPYSPQPPPTLFGVHVDAHLTVEQSTTLRRFALEFDRRQVKLKSGKRVVGVTDAVKFMLEIFAEQMAHISK